MVSKIDATIMKNFSSTKSPFGGVAGLVDPELAMPDHPWVGLLTFDCRNIAFVDRVQVCLQRLASRYRGTKWI